MRGLSGEIRWLISLREFHKCIYNSDESTAFSEGFLLGRGRCTWHRCSQKPARADEGRRNLSIMMSADRLVNSHQHSSDWKHLSLPLQGRYGSSLFSCFDEYLFLESSRLYFPLSVHPLDHQVNEQTFSYSCYVK